MWLDRLSWLEVDLGSIGRNIDNIKKIVGRNVSICAVLKANAYGHGLARVGKYLDNRGIDFLGVASLNEALILRNEGVGTRILLLGYSDPTVSDEIVEYDLTPTVFSLDSVISLNKSASKKNKKVRLHIKVDTGMGRLGLLPSEVGKFIERVKKLSNIKVEGIFTHFNCSEDENNKQTDIQLSRFNKIIKEAQINGTSFEIIHSANSGAILNHKASYYNMVRPGIMIYGYVPEKNLQGRIKLSAALSWKTQVTRVKELEADECVSYGCVYRTTERTKIATLAVGYADGVRRGPRGWKEVLVRGQKAKVVGRICMDQMCIDVSKITYIKPGDEVVLLGKQGNEEITVFDAAQNLGTIHYELLTQISERVVRIYH